MTVEPTETPISETPPADETRRRLVERFAAWLDETLARPEPPQGIAAELLAELEDAAEGDEDSSPADLYSLWFAVTAQTQEVRLQGRAFQRLTDEVAPLGAALEATRHAHQDALAEARRVAEEALGQREERDARSASELERRVRRQTVGVLLDLRDRLDRGYRTAADQLAEMPSAAPRALRLFRRLRDAWERPLAAARALAKGYALSLERLDEELDRLGVRPLESLRQPFDPHTMTVVDVAQASPGSDGTVIEVYQRGYAWGDEVLRPARVKVGRARRDETGRTASPAGFTGGDDPQENQE